jgi:hypothetical protein
MIGTWLRWCLGMRLNPILTANLIGGYVIRLGLSPQARLMVGAST